MQEILTSSVTQLAKYIREEKYSSLLVVEIFIKQIKIVNPTLNAIIYPRFSEAMEEAEEADRLLKKGIIKGGLHGVPITIKECLDLIGTPSTFGLKRRAEDFPVKNDPYVQKLIDEGAIILGKTNVSQLLAFFEADNPLYGRTNNPLNFNFSCGGSSGGEGAIIAALGSPLGLGTDLGGSVRIPAAFCGILGFKPTMWRNYDFSRIIENVQFNSICSVTGILGRSVEDLALVGKLIGEIPNPFNKVPQKFPDYNKVFAHEIRVGYFLSDGLFEASSAIRKGVLEAVEILGKQGIMSKEIEPFSPKKAEALQTRINSFNGAELFLDNLQKDKPAKQIAALIPLIKLPQTIIRMIGNIAGIFGQKTIKRLSRHFGFKGEKALAKLEMEHREYIEYCLNRMNYENINVILSPVNALPAYLHGSSVYLGSAGTYTLTHSVNGFPAGVVPLRKIKKEDILPRKKTWEKANSIARKIDKLSEDLSVSVQVAAAPWREDLVLKTMHILSGGTNA